LKLSQISHVKTTMMYNKYKSLAVIVVIVSLEKTSATVLLLILQQWSVLSFLYQGWDLEWKQATVGVSVISWLYLDLSRTQTANQNRMCWESKIKHFIGKGISYTLSF